MRIVCQKCAAAYGIDDRIVSTQGVRAQCPRCRAIQMVRKQDALPQPEAAAMTVQMPKLSSRMTRVPSEEDSDVEEVTSDEITNVTAENTVDLPSPLSGQGLVKCRKCSQLLTDAFDRALGICSDCSLGESESTDITEVADPARMGDRTVVVPNPVMSPVPGALIGTPTPMRTAPRSPLPPPDVSDFSRSPLPAATMPWVASVRDPSEHEKTMEAVIPELAADPAGKVSTLFPLQQRQRRKRQARIIGLAAGGLVLAVVTLVVLLWPEGGTTKSPSSVPEPVTTAVERWRQVVGEPQGESRTFLAEGGSQLSMDTPAGYAQAVRAFQRALLLDPSSDEAIAGYVQSLALGWSEGLDEKTYEEALALIGAAQRRSGRDAASLVAHANLLLSQKGQDAQQLDEVRRLADEALSRAKGQDQAEALVVKGRVLLVQSPEQAGAALDAALGLPEAPWRAHYYRALAHRANGEYRAAVAELARRLSTDPAHLESLSLLARLYEEVGEPALARDAYTRALEQSPGQPQIVVALAALRYRALGKAPQAIEELAEVAHEPSAEPDIRRDALVHLAAVNRTTGRLEAAATAVADALALDATSPAAHLQGFLTALASDKADQAATHLTVLKGRFDNPALETLLQGRLAVAQGKFPDAVEIFTKAAEQDSRRLDALLWAGASAASRDASAEAFPLLSRAMTADPTRLGPLPEDPRLSLTSADLLAGVENRVAKLALPQDPTARLYEGLIRYHQGDLAGADNWLRQALAIDDANAPGHALRALVALARNDRGTAKAQAERAVAVDEQLPLAHYALGKALLSSGSVNGAQLSLNEALSLAPSFLAAEVALAEVESRRKHVPEAKKRLTRVVTLDPSYLPAKRALYLMGQ
ncbi:MAG: tetratricopeptide repeat protein [Myxococcaceae bacterium]